MHLDGRRINMTEKFIQNLAEHIRLNLRITVVPYDRSSFQIVRSIIIIGDIIMMKQIQRRKLWIISE